MLIGSTEWKQLLEAGAGEMRIDITSRQIDQLTIHAQELSYWQKKINLTSIKDPKLVAVKHFLDSMAPVKIIPSNGLLLDIGTGGGFPGIPLKIYLPDLRVTLIDSSRKKVSFLKHIIRKISLKGIDAIEGRVENLSPPTRFDIIVSRALSSLDILIQTGWPLLADEGMMIAYKGVDIEAEMKTARSVIIEDGSVKKSAEDLLSFRVENYTLPYLDLKRSLVLIRRLQ